MSFDITTPAGQITVGLIVFAGFLVLVGAGKGANRRFGRSVLRLISIIGAIVCAALITRSIFDNIDVYMTNTTVQTALEKTGAAEYIAQARTMFPDLFKLLLSLPVSFVTPIVFTVVFFLLSILLAIPYWILAAILFPHRRGSVRIPGSGLLGFIVGAVQGAVVVLVYVIPLVGYAVLGGTVIDTVGESITDNETYRTVSEQYNLYANPLIENPVVKICYEKGGDKLFAYLTGFTYEQGEKKYDVSLAEEIPVYANIFSHAQPLTGTTLEEFGEEQSNAIKSIADDIDRSEVLPIVVAGVLSKACTCWDNNETFFDIARPKVDNAQAQRMIDSAIETFKNSTPETVTDDLRALANTIGVMVKYDVMSKLQSEEDMLALLTDEALIEELMNTLSESENLKSLMVETAKVGVQAVCSSLIEEEAYEEACTAIADGTSNVLNTLSAVGSDLPAEEKKEAQVEALSQTITDTMETYGVPTDTGTAIVPFVAEFIIDEFAEQIETGSVSSEDVLAYLALSNLPQTQNSAK